MHKRMDALMTNPTSKPNIKPDAPAADDTIAPAADVGRTMTAPEMAHAIGVNPKAFRSFVRSQVERAGGVVGVNTPGSGARYRFENVTDATIEQVRAQYASHRRTNNSMVIDLGAIMPTDDGAPAADQ